jgi:hypothetical protein
MEEAAGVSSPTSSERRRKGLPLWPIYAFLGLCLLGTGAYFLSNHLFPKSEPTSTLTTRPSATLLIAVRDLSRLETTELHLEKVIDLTDRQSRFFGLVEGEDALLLVASGDVVMGLDLSQLKDDDIAMDPTTKVATLRLPKPQALSVHLDEKRTYVYRRTTSLLAERNEQLETKARQQALEAIEKAARESDVGARSQEQAERTLRQLAMALGATDVKFIWR